MIYFSVELISLFLSTSFTNLLFLSFLEHQHWKFCWTTKISSTPTFNWIKMEILYQRILSYSHITDFLKVFWYTSEILSIKCCFLLKMAYFGLWQHWRILQSCHISKENCKKITNLENYRNSFFYSWHTYFFIWNKIWQITLT